MKKTSAFEWNHQAGEAFHDLKHVLSTAPVLAVSAMKEPLLLYIAVTSHVVNMVLAVECPEEGKAQPVQRPVYYLSEVLSLSKQNYRQYQKMCYDVYLAAKKLKHYFQEHTITVAFREWEARDANMATYRFLVQQLFNDFDGCSIPGPTDPGPASGPAGSISGAAVPVPSSGAAGSIPVAAVPGSANAGLGDAEPALAEVAVLTIVTAPSWAQPILAFLESSKPPVDEVETRQVQRWALAYTIINNELINRSAIGVFQRCVEPDKGHEILLDIHQGECGHHAASRALVAKAFRYDFYWPTALEDTERLVLKFEGCQRFSKSGHQPASALQTITITWPFAVWGLDMVGPFKTTQDGMTHLLVAMDKFTKWIKARPIKKLDGPTPVRFLMDIAVRYDVPHNIITDNSTNFAKGALAQYCSTSGIRLNLASIADPQSNGQVERANDLILAGIKLIRLQRVQHPSAPCPRLRLWQRRGQGPDELARLPEH
ncbi:uncharacterized protein [Aegilops tauschii subsp. strangulata]|uniref:uncharacterized protein n=1 Tax=Aegilops tauschii subsp. strangulata TaxID=200361 RepID=UPI00098BC8BC|nr:uncharacterized protein LOC109783902 [Aegilops tauschii subsp. strangulata]